MKNQEKYIELYAFDEKAREEFAVSAGFEKGIHPVLAGIDEAGRGPLAGPVVVAGVILPSEITSEYKVFDSKQVAEHERDELANELLNDSRVKVAIAVISAARIDEVNILRATHEGMRQVARELSPDICLVDGLKVPDFPLAARFVVKGDANSASIAAASIIAKTHRDKLLVQLDAKYPEYGFAKHKGYGTKEHLEALRRFGICPEHRRSFGPVRDILEPPPVQMELFPSE